MTKVFFGGSRKIRELSQAVKERTDNIITNGYLILLGDANGADKAMQRYLSEKGYRNVLVFCMGNVCRNNLGNWETRKVFLKRSKKDFAYYSTKDVLMSEEADYGFMLWEGQSKGTLNNILNLYDRGKNVLVYFYPENCFYTVKDEQDLEKLLGKCENGLLKKYDKILGISQRINLKQEEINFV